MNSSILAGCIILITGLRVAMAPYPNVEPITLLTLVTGLTYGPVQAALLGFGSLAFSDIVMGLPGPWTIYCGLTFGVIGAFCGILGTRKKKWGRVELTALIFVLTIFYDAVTATFWALQTMQPLSVVYAAQVPFTLLHLSNCILAYILAPSLINILERTKDFSLSKTLNPLRFLV